MKQIIALTLIVVLSMSCSKGKDEDVNCSLFDPIFPGLYIRLVDESGSNLIENGTIDPDEISVEGNFSEAGFRLVTGNELGISDFHHTLYLYFPRESSYRFSLHLNNTDSIEVNLTTEIVNIPCDISYSIPTGVEQNGETLELIEASPLQFLVEIELLVSD